MKKVLFSTQSFDAKVAEKILNGNQYAVNMTNKFDGLGQSESADFTIDLLDNWTYVRRTIMSVRSWSF